MDLKKKIWIAGGDGLVGRRLVQLLDKSKYDIEVLSRKKRPNNTPSLKYIYWQPENATISSESKPDIIINLAGAGIADARWTHKRKKQLIDSRVLSGKAIFQYLSDRNHSPEVYIGASAVGYYGNQGDSELYENSPSGVGFMAECCNLWEKNSAEAAKLCDRVVTLRIGIVLSMLGGALPKMLMTHRLGIFNYFGSGSQYYPWIHIDDLCRVVVNAVENKIYQGIFNAVAPDQITHKNFMKAIISKVFSRGILLPVPAWILKILLGEMSDVVLNSNRVIPQNLTKIGFKFDFNDVGDAVKDVFFKKI